MKLSVLIPTQNPRTDYLWMVLDALSRQTLAISDWELIVIDNASDHPLSQTFQADWHPHFQIIREEVKGLSRARMAGFRQAKGSVMVLVDDDNELDKKYLETVCSLSNDHPFLGAWSGNVELVCEKGAPSFPKGWGVYLTERHLKQALWSNDPQHHDSTPWGAGLCVRREVAKSYLQRSDCDPALLQLDLQGTNLIYGGDTDIAYHACSMGLGKGVFPQLQVRHLIPAKRCERDYLLKVMEGRAYSEMLHHYILHKTIQEESRSLVTRLKKLTRLILNSVDERAAEMAWRRGQQRFRSEFASKL
jgi:glycosyltransferase involved in cell wall biosynthesis